MMLAAAWYVILDVVETVLCEREYKFARPLDMLYQAVLVRTARLGRRAGGQADPFRAPPSTAAPVPLPLLGAGDALARRSAVRFASWHVGGPDAEPALGSAATRAGDAQILRDVLYADGEGLPAAQLDCVRYKALVQSIALVRDKQYAALVDLYNLHESDLDVTAYAAPPRATQSAHHCSPLPADRRGSVRG